MKTKLLLEDKLLNLAGIKQNTIILENNESFQTLTKKQFVEFFKKNDVHYVGSTSKSSSEILNKLKSTTPEEIANFNNPRKFKSFGGRLLQLTTEDGSTTRIELGSDKSTISIIYKFNNFLFVEDRVDNSKDDNTSNNDIIYNTVIYIIK